MPKLSVIQDVYHQQFSVSFDYPVHFSRNIFSDKNPLLAEMVDRKGGNKPHRAIVYIDSGVMDVRPGILEQVKTYFAGHGNMMALSVPPVIIEGGENAKTGWSAVRQIMTAIGDCHLDRQSFVIAVGGGSIQDMVGFAASLVHRGLRFIRIPTTVLSQNDAGVGVKNGMNEREQKNYVGAFAPPWAVINDFDFLTTLPPKDWAGGIAEAFKVALIKDKDFFSFLCENAAALRERSAAAMEELVYRCAILHLEHIRNSGDPFEFGSSRPLDFGHWSAHKLEVLSLFSLGHGQAVSIGIALDVYYAARQGFITEGERDAILRGMSESGLPVWHPLLKKRNSRGVLEVLQGLQDFREHLGGRLTLAMPDGIGRQQEINEMDVSVVEEAIGFLETGFGNGPPPP